MASGERHSLKLQTGYDSVDVISGYFHITLIEESDGGSDGHVIARGNYQEDLHLLPKTSMLHVVINYPTASTTHRIHTANFKLYKTSTWPETASAATRPSITQQVFHRTVLDLRISGLLRRVDVEGVPSLIGLTKEVGRTFCRPTLDYKGTAWCVSRGKAKRGYRK